jgi:hypothetical protein
MQIQERQKKTRRSSAECCTDSRCESGLRNNYFDHKRLSTESLRVEQQYSLERRRLLNRAIHGWGVVNGYAIAVVDPDECDKGEATGQLRIGPGLALDSCGRELLNVRSHIISLGDVTVLQDGKGIKISDVQQLQEEDCWLLRAHYAEQSTSPVGVTGSCQCEHREWDYTCETVRFSLTRIDCGECCETPECELECECSDGPCCGSGRTEEELRRPTDMRIQRGGCRCICDYLTEMEFDDCCGPLCPIDEPCERKVRVDLGHGIPLACVNVVRDGCGGWSFGKKLEVCGPRHLIKRNDLLFDLIRGCDLTRIIEISWWHWHRKKDAIPFKEFSEYLGNPTGKDEEEYVTKFSVEFSRPVRVETLLPDCFTITVMSAEREGGWLETLRVPIVRIDTDKYSEAGLKNHVRGGTIVVDGSWLEDKVWDRTTRFVDEEAWVEIEIRGDFILDCNGQSVDANAVGLYPYPSGNGSPGGTFRSTFRVAPAPDSHYRGRGA